MTEYEVRSLIKELVSSTEKAAKEKGLEFKVTVKKEIPCRLYGDEAELKRRLLDILSNAVNNTETGFVTMSVNYEETDPDMMLLKIRVADTGKGVSPEDIEKLTAADRHLQISSVCGKGSIISYTIEQKIINRAAQLRGISGINVDAGIQACGTEEIYLSVVKEFYPPAEKQAALIEQYNQERDYRNYTIQVHSLKSSARLIGALELSEQAKRLEACGNAEDQQTIEAETPALLRTYRSYADQIRQIFESPEDEAAKPLLEEKRLREALETLSEVAEVFDFDSADLIMETLSKYRMPEPFQESYEKLKTFMAEVARDDIIDLIHGYLGREEH